jgi:hypothetical protein
MDMNGNNHYVAVDLYDDLFEELEQNSDATATVFIPYTNKINYVVHRMVRKFGRRLQVLEMNMAMESNRLHIANRFIELNGGVLWKSSRLKPALNQKKQSILSKRGNDMESWAKFLDGE